MAKNASNTVIVAKRGNSRRANSASGPQTQCRSMQTAPNAARAGLSLRGKTPAQNQSSRVSALARILRPQASQRWTMPHIAAITPQYVEMVLRSALAGDHVRQWELFQMMLDSWPELAACQNELIEGVMAQEIAFSPWAEEGEPPTAAALQKQKLVSAALRRMQPDPCADENDLEDTLKDILDGWFRGVTALEVEWFRTPAGVLGDIIAPRATFWAHPDFFAWGADGRLGLRDGQTVQPFPPHKFLVGIHKAKSGSALGGSILRPLAWWWCAANFASDWLLNLAQLFGLPFRWANHDPNASQETVDAICSMLQNMGSAGWAAFPAGTTLELKDTGTTGDKSPQGDLLDRADRYARMLILGQTMSGSQDSSKGGGKAFGSVEEKVKNARIDAAAKYACKVLNSQLIPSIVELNYGTRDESPAIALLADRDTGIAEAQRDQILSGIMPLSVKQLRQKYALDEPAPGDETKSPSAAPASVPSAPVTGEPPTNDPLLSKLCHISQIGDDALFTKALTDLAATL